MPPARAGRTSGCSSRTGWGKSRTPAGKWAPPLMYPRRSSSKTYPSAPSTTPACSRSRIPRWLLTGMARHEAFRGEAGDILDRFAIEGQFRQGPPDKRRELVTGAAPHRAARPSGKSGEVAQDEGAITDHVKRA